ncbi:hypothetical protein MNEG_12386 [Monoraphidium neglectum]|uniref:Uncharacterized protein n=1 Tax=Monoraphidium neglectum TaxID=145388 RepID=A0A0D2ML30_9CHLO|nr:hypothetical protein MNEG_12386 [Monoraphidium neglectum]KIY95575.1 hypothetical protein MNEG_12386 [Monoraphidium neglectum]|eukprot:XP_013894595.1 hypothetical protein MNEG_12386 [Monoraphidium neglectum]
MTSPIHSYGRWDEARKMWGLVLNRSRDIARQGLSYIPDDRQDLRDMLCRWTPAFSRSLMTHLRKGEDLREELKDILRPHELDSLLMSTHRPNYCLQVLSQVVKDANAGTAATIRMDDNITAFEDCLGGCERILKTPVPLSYTRHTSRFLIIWLTMLPFTLYGSCGFATVPLCCVIAFLLLGIEEIGVSIEEPFSILALQAICDSALNNVRELQAQHDISKAKSDQYSAIELVSMAAAEAAGASATAAAAESHNGNGNGNGSRAPSPAFATAGVANGGNRFAVAPPGSNGTAASSDGAGSGGSNVWPRKGNYSSVSFRK